MPAVQRNDRRCWWCCEAGDADAGLLQRQVADAAWQRMARTCRGGADGGGGDADWGAWRDDDVVHRSKRRGHGAARANTAIASGFPRLFRVCFLV